MARVTVEDCIEQIPNRFDLVLTASQRARGISSGDPVTIDRDNDKNPVVALREIADQTISIDDINENLVKSLQRMKRREEEQSALDEKASMAQDDMASFNSDFGADRSDSIGMQIGVGRPQEEGGASFADEGQDEGGGSFADEGEDEGSFADENVDDDS